MKKLHIGAILLGGLVVAPFQASMAQTTNVAYGYASDPRPAYVVFFDKGTSQLSGVADETIRRAAADTDKAAAPVRVVGRADHAAAGEGMSWCATAFRPVRSSSSRRMATRFPRLPTA